jgi:Putative zinc-finger
MSTRADCDHVRELAPELALGIADGKERAEALAHIASCAACRSYLGELTDVADDLLALAPSEEPPVGFETRVLTQLGIEPPSPRRRPRLFDWPRRALVPAAAAFLVAAAFTASAFMLAFQDERELASQYQSALDNVGGEYFQATRLYDARQTPVGQVFGYQGEPSWLFVVVYSPFRETALTGSLTTTGGDTVPLDSLDLSAERATWGGQITIDLRDVELVRLVDQRGNVYQARIPGGPGE